MCLYYCSFGCFYSAEWHQRLFAHSSAKGGKFKIWVHIRARFCDITATANHGPVCHLSMSDVETWNLQRTHNGTGLCCEVGDIFWSDLLQFFTYSLSTCLLHILQTSMCSIETSLFLACVVICMFWWHVLWWNFRSVFILWTIKFL